MDPSQGPHPFHSNTLSLRRILPSRADLACLSHHLSFLTSKLTIHSHICACHFGLSLGYDFHKEGSEEVKHWWCRSRPELNVNVKKPHHFRKKEKNNAMPSGDAIQGALFSVFLLFLGLDPLWIGLFHLGVCLGRVYYMCHWVADTLVASILGYSIGSLILRLYSEGVFEFVPL